MDSNITITRGAPGGTSYCFGIVIIDDNELENDEQFLLQIESASDYVAAAEGFDQLTVTIEDNERMFNVAAKL